MTIPSNAKVIEQNLKRFPKVAEKEYARAVQEAAAAYRDFTKSMRPVSLKTTSASTKGIPVDRGALRRSIKKKRIAKLAAGITIGGDASKYGIHVHEGTKNVKSRPFFQWSLDLGAKKIIDKILARATKRILRGI